MNKFRHNESGFTLIEMIAAITIVSVLIAGLAAGTRLLSMRWNDHISSLNENDRHTTAMQLLHRDVESMVSVRAGGGAESVPVFSGSHTRLQFVALEPASPSLPGPYLLTYRTRPSKSGTALVRSRVRIQPGFTGVRAGREADVVLLDGLNNFVFSYGVFTAGSTIWSPTWADGDQFPNFIRLEIRDPSSGTLLELPTVARVRVSAGIDCASPRSKLCAVANGRIIAGVAR